MIFDISIKALSDDEKEKAKEIVFLLNKYEWALPIPVKWSPYSFKFGFLDNKGVVRIQTIIHAEQNEAEAQRLIQLMYISGISPDEIFSVTGLHPII